MLLDFATGGTDHGWRSFAFNKFGAYVFATSDMYHFAALPLGICGFCSFPADYACSETKK